MKISRILPLIGVVIFLYLIFRIGVRNIAESLASANLTYLIIAVLFLPLILLFQTLKWASLLKSQKINISLKELMKIQAISIFYGFVTPARIGSFIKVSYVNKKTKNLGKSLNSVLLDKIFDIFTVTILAIIGCLILSNYFSKVLLNIFIFLIILLIPSVYFISKKRSKKVLRFVYKWFLPKRMKKGGRTLFNAFYDTMPNKKYWVAPILLNFVSWLIFYSQTFLIARAFNINLPIFIFLFIVPISTIIAEIPITISGLGIREASLIKIFSIFGIGAADVFAMSITSTVVNLLLSIAGFILSFKDLKV